MSGPPFRGLPAGIVTRTMACVVDALVVVLLLLLLWGGWSVLKFLARPSRFTFPSPSWALVLLTGSVAAILYLGASWAVSGRSYGAQVLGLRVVNRALGPLGWPRSLLRSAACVVFPLGLAWTLLDRRNRSLQDVLCASRVVYDWVPRAAPDHMRGSLADAEIPAEWVRGSSPTDPSAVAETVE